MMASAGNVEWTSKNAYENSAESNGIRDSKRSVGRFCKGMTKVGENANKAEKDDCTYKNFGCPQQGTRLLQLSKS